MNVEKAKFGRFVLKDCANCKKAFNYQVANIQIDGINNYLCDNCLKVLAEKIKEYLNNKIR